MAGRGRVYRRCGCVDPVTGTVPGADSAGGAVGCPRAGHVHGDYPSPSGAGSPMSAGTLSRIRAPLRAALNAAIRSGLIADTPASRAELPRARRPRAVVWTPARVEH